jgi:cobalamin biosynthesis Mg chelatase CobN
MSNISNAQPVEQPGAIKSDVNTAPFEPVLGNKRSKPRETEVTSITTPHAPNSLTACTSVTPALPITGDSTEPSRSTENKPISSGSTETSEIKDNTPSKQEQRSTSQAEDGESSEAPHPARPQDVSKEALQGPQGPAPKSAEDFENEAKRKRSVAKDNEKSMFPFICASFVVLVLVLTLCNRFSKWIEQ